MPPADKGEDQPIRDEDESKRDDNPDDDDDDDESTTSSTQRSSSALVTGLQLAVAAGFLFSGVSTLLTRGSAATRQEMEEAPHRRLLETDGSDYPTYVEPLMKDLQARKKLFDETPPEEIKYWFEYTGPLQKYFYRFSRSRGKADYFEGRDDSGVVSARFIEEPGGGKEYQDFFLNIAEAPDKEMKSHIRLLENCLSMGAPSRPNTGKGTLWNDWFGSSSNPPGQVDRCRILFTINSVGAGRGTTMLWETNPPPVNAQGPKPWQSEQETAGSHLERNLKEIDSMCATGQIAARVQMLVCEPIPAKWTEWMDSMLVNCGGKPPKPMNEPNNDSYKVEERASPVQIVVVASAATADTCHDLKSGFMERRMQDLVMAPPYLGDEKNRHPGSSKTTHPDLISSDDHDLYVAMKWSSLVTIRSVNSFLQASADLAAAAASPKNQKAHPELTEDGTTVAISNSPSSPFLVPSFVRVSYVSEENSKVAKWRMHGDFFHPAAWEICKDSFDMTWIPDSLSGGGGVKSICSATTSTGRRLAEEEECGQWWVFFAELQMPITPEVYANEAVSPLVEGGSNFFWMVTERQRREMVKGLVCQREKGDDSSKCPKAPQAVLPLGDLESFLINFTPNTALGKKHTKGRRPGYSKEQERELDRQRVKDRKQLHDQEDIEKALFDYTIYPAALFRKDATIMAARARDLVLTKNRDTEALGPQTIKSSYYDVTITKPRPPLLGWCQAIARKGLCTLYADYFRSKKDERCLEACGLKKNWAKI